MSQMIYYFKKQGVHADGPLKHWSYWTEVHEIYTQYSQITDDFFKIRMAVLP